MNQLNTVWVPECVQLIYLHHSYFLGRIVVVGLEQERYASELSSNWEDFERKRMVSKELWSGMGESILITASALVLFWVFQLTESLGNWAGLELDIYQPLLINVCFHLQILLGFLFFQFGSWDPSHKYFHLNFWRNSYYLNLKLKLS